MNTNRVVYDSDEMGFRVIRGNAISQLFSSEAAALIASDEDAAACRKYATAEDQQDHSPIVWE